MAVRCALVLLLVCVVPQLVVEGCWPSKPAGRLMTRCEKERADGPADGVLPMNSFVKQCEADGSYSTVQCGGSRRFCYCAHPETGVIYKETKTRGQPRSCDNYYILREDTRTPCEKQMYSLNPAMLPGGFIKECEADGSFRKAQRDSAGLWYCVNSETGELYGQTGMRSQIDCDEYEARNDAPAVHVARATPCEKQKFSLDPAMLPGGFIKECEADGSFRKEQRDSSGLWYCVNSETGELYGQTGMRSQIDCVEYEAAVHAEADQDELTPCEKQMDSDNPTMLPGGFIKECEADGSFARTQCDSEGLCYCVNTETGVPYPPGRRGPIDCDAYLAMVHAEADQDERTPCEKQRDSDNPTMLPGGFIKECEADGSFSKLQCDSEGLCYCVNTETGELYGQTGMRGVFDCEEYQAMHDAGENWFRGR
ncbi:Hypp6429 [Branchiostoma lanceolatum]|uniref:Hypp6429 protein n=1 Tax=Branchiostoma lanceolatum TaxID=7740 RepID=A0A8J9YUC4_BRALA|nr:Hypp6429 [Branchiostoma lanceolatum]